MDSVEATMNSIDVNQADGLEKRMSAIETEVKKLDDEGKFNIRKWMRDNWIGLAVGLMALVYFGTTVVKNIIV